MLRRRLAGRIAATTAALSLAATAVVLDGQASPGAPDPSRAAAAGTQPTSAQITIEPAPFGGRFTPRNQELAPGGVLTVVNNTQFNHTFTSVAVGNDGLPLFDVTIPAKTAQGPTVRKIRVASTLQDGVYSYYCAIHPTMTGTLTIGSGGPVVTAPKFEQPLVQPPRLHGKHLRIVMRKAKVRVLPHGPRTPMLTFGGTFPGPTIMRQTGQDTKVTFVNRLPRRDGAVTIHQHAGHQQSRYDGQPASFLIRHGRKRTYDFPLTDGGKPLPAALRFYHDHRMDRTARNNWLGLQGMFLTTDPREKKLGLPHGRYDIPLAITDRSFRRHNRLTNPFKHMRHMTAMPGMETVGDRVLVNGRFAPYQRVRPGLYRLQILNSSLFSSYDFALSDGRPFRQIGTGSGLLPAPVVRQDILLGPAQRADVVVDFRGLRHKNVLLLSIPRTDAVKSGAGTRTAALMQFRVRGTHARKAHVPNRLAKIEHLKVPKKVAKTWRFGLSKGGHGPFWSINGKRFDPKRVDHRVRLGSTERWKLVNTSRFTHYVHLHEELWRTLERDGRRPPPWERGYEDTWKLDPGESVVVAARFSDFTGDFMIHCHMLDHEDAGMMATWRVVRRR